jgi:hypothetical protein
MLSFARKQLVNISLVVLAVGLVIAVLATTGHVTTSEQEARENNLLGSYREDQLQKLTLERKGQRIVLEKLASEDAGESSWFIMEPIREEADPVSVQKLLGTLEFATVARRIKPDEVNRALFGLDAPRFVLSIEMGPISYRLRIGNEAVAPPGASYLEITGDGAPRKGVVIISKELVKELGVEVGQLRGQEMMPYLSASLERVKLDGEGGVRPLRRGDWGGFRFDGVQADRRVNREALDRIFLQFARTKAERFIDRAAAERALGSGKTVNIEMRPRDAKRPTGIVSVGGKCPSAEGVVAFRRAPDALAACVPDSVMTAFTTPAEELVDRNLFSLRLDEVESLSIGLGGKRLELERKGEGFAMRAPQKADVDPAAGNQRIESILGIRGELQDSGKPAEFGLEPAAGQATIKSTSEPNGKLREEGLVIGATGKDGGAYVRRVQDGAILKIQRDALRVLLPDATLVKSRKILEFNERQLRALSIKGANLEQRLIRNASNEYVLEIPRGFPHDAGLVSDVVSALSMLATDRWVADTNDGSFGLENPTLELRITLSSSDGGANSERAIRIGDATSGGAYALLEDSPGVFVFPRRALEILQTPLLDRSPFIVNAAATDRVELAYKGRKIVLERQGDEFVERSPNPALSKGRIQQIVEALESMRAEAAVNTGPPRPDQGLQKPELEVTAESKTRGGEPQKVVRYRIGAADAWQAMSVFYGRVEGLPATFVIARSKLSPILDAF